MLTRRRRASTNVPLLLMALRQRCVGHRRTTGSDHPLTQLPI